ncbi:hypothetical protein [Streptomyces sp. MA5143a]|uniref:hypothetical protein n=1 Tax=Streptomyces sp. MA5143a TaxID=2083010 RepID=UPI000D1C1B56|nr:hypothetical protein [Streptomyces sp. MA5143a]SPE99512.1 hypothetical protein SMA5143A_0220 [Streptomyces sp. MA5143a]
MNRSGTCGNPQRIASVHVATVVAEALYAQQRETLYGARRPVDVDQAHARLAGYDPVEAVRALRDPHTYDPTLHPPAAATTREVSGVVSPVLPRRTSGEPSPEEERADFLARLFRAAREVLDRLGEEMGTPIALIGAEGEHEERLELFRSHVLAERPVVSVSVTGCPQALLIRGDARAASLSVLVWLPSPPLAAATVTLESALIADCTSAYRLSPEGEWEELTEDTPAVSPGTGYLVFPWSMVARADLLTKEFPKIEFQEETTSAIIQAVLNHRVPAAIHPSGEVLDSAILLVAAAQGLTVRLHDVEGTPMTALEASKMLFRAVREGSPTLPGVIIARGQETAQWVAELLGGVRA